MEGNEIRLKHLADNVYSDAVVSETEDSDGIMLSTFADGKLFSGKDEDYFTAFRKLRDSLLTEGYGMCCAGARINAVQSGMMAGTDRVYLVSLGEKAVQSNVRGIFDYVDMDNFPDSAEQDEFTEKFYRSI